MLILKGVIMKRHHKSPYPASSSYRRDEPAATDTLYSDAPVTENGSKVAKNCSTYWAALDSTRRASQLPSHLDENIDLKLKNSFTENFILENTIFQSLSFWESKKKYIIWLELIILVLLWLIVKRVIQVDVEQYGIIYLYFSRVKLNI